MLKLKSVKIGSDSISKLPKSKALKASSVLNFPRPNDTKNPFPFWLKYRFEPYSRYDKLVDISSVSIENPL